MLGFEAQGHGGMVYNLGMNPQHTYTATDFLKAIHRAEVKDLEAMIAHGADINAQSGEWSPAMQACGDGQIKCLRVLISAGADLNAGGERGMTPLIVAAMEGDDQCLGALLKAGVDLEKKDEEGRTAVWYAAAYGSLACLVRLFKAGVDIDECQEGQVNGPCIEALGAERAKREKEALAKAAPKTKAKVSVKPPRI